MSRNYRGELCTLPDYADRQRTGEKIEPDGLSIAEIAERVGLKPKHVSKIIQRAIEKMRIEFANPPASSASKETP